MRKNKPYTLLDKAEPYLWILPSVILMAIFIIVPIGSVFRMSMSEVSKAGIVKGFIGFEKRGDKGFGYDPIFYVGEEKTALSFAEMSAEQKDGLSHRGKAMALFEQELTKMINKEL